MPDFVAFVSAMDFIRITGGLWFFIKTGTVATLERQGSGLIFIRRFGVYFYANQGVIEDEVVCFLPCARKVNGLQKQ